MKIIWRTLIILLAAAVVTAGTMGAMQLPAVQSWIGSQGGERHGPPAGMTNGEFAQAPTFAASAATSAAGDTDDATAASGQQAPPMRGENGGRSGGNLTQASQELGMAKTTLFDKVKKYGLAH